MKRVYIFDVDNTLRSSKYQKVLPQTVKLIEELSKNPDYVLGLATGRGPSKMYVLDGLSKYFKYKILVNGAVILENDEILFEDPIDADDVDFVVKDTLSKGFSMGMVGFKQEAVTLFDDHVEYALKGYTSTRPILDPKFHLKEHVYQLWVFHRDQEILNDLVKNYKNFTPYLWHYGGVDLVYPRISKESAVQKLMEKYQGYQLITIGDGHNDIEMIRMADIGILMDNSRWKDEAEDAADLIAPHVEDDKLYDFFKENNLL